MSNTIIDANSIFRDSKGICYAPVCIHCKHFLYPRRDEAKKKDGTVIMSLNSYRCNNKECDNYNIPTLTVEFKPIEVDDITLYKM